MRKSPPYRWAKVQPDRLNAASFNVKKYEISLSHMVNHSLHLRHLWCLANRASPLFNAAPDPRSLGWCRSTEDKSSYIFFRLNYMQISRRFGVTAWKRNCRKQKVVVMATSLDRSKIEVQIIHLHPLRNRTLKTAWKSIQWVIGLT